MVVSTTLSAVALILLWNGSAALPNNDLASPSSSTKTTHPEIISRNKKGRIQQLLDDKDVEATELCELHFNSQLLALRGGSNVVMSPNHKSGGGGGDGKHRATRNSGRSRQQQAQYNQEIDAYIDFLIATYCTDDNDDNGRDGGKRREGSHHHHPNNHVDQPKVEISIHSDGGKQQPIDQNVRDTIADQQQQQQQSDHPSGSSLSSLSEEAIAPTEAVQIPQPLADSNNAADNIDNGGGDDDDDGNDDSEDAESELLLDQYIEFLQEDFENDQRLDQYIDFLQEDYEADQALDHYIEFLLATTTATAPTLLSGKPNAAMTASTTTTPTSPLPAAATVVNAEEMIILSDGSGEATQDSSVRTLSTIKTELDDYIDRLVTAVELDEYIDRLVGSVAATADQDALTEEDEEAEIGRMEETEAAIVPTEEATTEVMDDYIDNILSSSQEGGEVQPQQRDQDAIATKAQEEEEDEAVAISATKLTNKVDDNSSAPVQHEPVSVDGSGNEASESERTTADVASESAPFVTTADLTSEDDTSNMIDLDQEAHSGDSPSVAVGVMEKGSSSTPGGDDDDDDKKQDEENDSVEVEHSAASNDGVKNTDASEKDDEKVPVPEATVLTPVPEATVLTPVELGTQTEVKSKKKRKKKIPKDLSTEPGQPAEQVAPATEDPLLDNTSAPEPVAEESEELVLSPNGLYRFLLQKGTFGHVLVLALVLLVEWIQVYVPQVADLLALLWLKLAPVGLQRRLAPQQYGAGDERAASSSFQQTYSGRMPVKGKDRKKLSKRADEEALAQLQRIGDIQDAKYKLVSEDFMKRHGLGPFRTESHDDNEVDEDSFESKPSKMKKKKRKKARDQEEEDDDSDVEWVLQGLTADKGEKKPLTKSASMEPSISFGVGSKGPSMEVGFEIDLGGSKSKAPRRRKSTLDREAITRDAVRKKTPGPRPGDRDGGSGVMGRLRAAATSNSLVSRSLLGAYPGDVPPSSEAADAGGVAGLARKYGYGEWSDDDDEDYDNLGRDGQDRNSRNTARRRKSKTKSKRIGSKNRPTTFDIGDLFDGDDNMEAPATPLTKKKRSKGTRRSAEKVRPALDILNEAKKAPRKKRVRKEKVDPMVRGIDELKKKDQKQGSSKLVRPAFQSLKEAESKLKQATDKPDKN